MDDRIDTVLKKKDRGDITERKRLVNVMTVPGIGRDESPTAMGAATG